jgi:S-adenosyl-L-methionine hydrolase (adenosine-forming)
MPAPLITLTTDFGLSDHLRGRDERRHPVDLPARAHRGYQPRSGRFEIAEAAFTLAGIPLLSARGTVHVVVVDPGVGTSRRPILAQAAGQSFVAPDNGVLSMVYAREKHKVRAISRRALLSAAGE